MKLISKGYISSGYKTIGAVLLLVVSVNVLAQAQLQPIKTRYAQTLSEVTMDGWFETFTGVELDEVEDFDGWTAGVDLTIPFLDRFQITLSLPLRTEGDATVKKTHFIHAGEPTSIEGNGGVFDYATIAFEHQLIHRQASGYNLSYYVGGGGITDSLETEITRFLGDADKINHNGKVFFAGIRMDTDTFGQQTLWNMGLRYYPASDDLHPGDQGEFVALDLRSAIIFAPWGSKLYPVLEFTYLGDFGDLNQISMIPELIIPINDHLELKAGAEIGLGGNGNEFGGQAEVSVRF